MRRKAFADNILQAHELRWVRRQILYPILSPYLQEQRPLSSSQKKQVDFLPYLLVSHLTAAEGKGYHYSMASLAIVDFLCVYDAFEFFSSHLIRNTDNLGLLEAAGLLRMKMMYRRKLDNEPEIQPIAVAEEIVGEAEDDDEALANAEAAAANAAALANADDAANFSRQSLTKVAHFDDPRFKDNIVQQTALVCKCLYIRPQSLPQLTFSKLYSSRHGRLPRRCLQSRYSRAR